MAQILQQYGWLLIAIASYLFFALASLADKIVLIKSPKPRVYTFYVGVFNVLAIFLIPFLPLFGQDFGIPSTIGFMWVILDGIIYIFGLYGMFSALEKFDASRVIPAIGASQPIFIFALTWLFWGPQILGAREMIAFALLLAGTVLISIDKVSKLFTRESLIISLVTSVLFSMDFVFSKFVFLEQPFWQGFIWIRLASFIFVLFLLLSRNFYHDIFEENNNVTNKTGAIFLSGQVAGGAATILQSFAIALVPICFLPIMNALKGLQYVFIFLFVVFFTFYLPKFLKEEISRATAIQKIISILIIILGLIVLFYKGTSLWLC